MLTSRQAAGKHARRQAGRQAGTPAHPLPLSVRRAVLLILVRAVRGCVSLLSSGSSSSSSSRTVVASGTAMEDTLTCSHATFSQVFGRQGQLMQASIQTRLGSEALNIDCMDQRHRLHPGSQPQQTSNYVKRRLQHHNSDVSLLLSPSPTLPRSNSTAQCDMFRPVLVKRDYSEGRAVETAQLWLWKKEMSHISHDDPGNPTTVQSLNSLNDQIAQFMVTKPCTLADEDEAFMPGERNTLRKSMTLMRHLLVDAQKRAQNNDRGDELN
ncbi:hypothetical protein INR49_029745 [Caranx melampygus]|nr:hypothetical protein INR49_029745 [Caranx melampygus]